MNNSKLKKVIFTAFLLFSCAGLPAQIIQSTQFAKGSISDGEKILRAYLLPLDRSFDAIGGSGFAHFHQKDKLKKINFSFGLQVLGAIAPSSDKSFDVNELHLSEFEPTDPANSIAQTFSGNADKIRLGTKATYKLPSTTFPFYTSKPILTLNSPEGIGSSVLSLANITASVFTKNFEFGLRVMPPIKVPKADAVIYSVGASLQAEMNTLIKALQTFPLGVSVLVGVQYTKLSLDPGLAPEPSRTEISLQANNGPYDTQEFNVTSRAVPIEIFLHKQVKDFIIYTGAGLNVAKTTTELKGKIPLYVTDPTNTFQIIVEDIEDPVSFSMQTNSTQFNLGCKYFYKSFGINSGFYFSKYKRFYLAFDIKI